MKTDTILQIVAVVVGSLTGIATYIVLKNLFEGKAKTLFRFEPQQEEDHSIEDAGSEDAEIDRKPFKVG